MNDTMPCWLPTKYLAIPKNLDWSHNYPAKTKLVIRNMQNGLEIISECGSEYGSLSWVKWIIACLSFFYSVQIIELLSNTSNADYHNKYENTERFFE